MGHEEYMLPDGHVTEDGSEFVNAWRGLAAPSMSLMGMNLYGYGEDGITLQDPKSGRLMEIPLAYVLLVTPHLPPADFLEVRSLLWSPGDGRCTR